MCIYSQRSPPHIRKAPPDYRGRTRSGSLVQPVGIARGKHDDGSGGRGVTWGGENTIIMTMCRYITTSCRYIYT